MKRWRKKMGLTQREAGELLGVTREHICRIEAGEYELSTVQRYAMQYLFECEKPRLWKD